MEGAITINKDASDDLLAGRDPQAAFAKDGLFDDLKKPLAERPGKPHP
jgi:putative transposase